MADLAVTDIGVKFGGLVALESASFAVPRGTVTGVIGPNGAGKTTLFNVMSGFVKPTSGSISWHGQPFHPRPDQLVREGIARTLQGVGLFARLTAVENVMVGAASTRRTGLGSALLALPGGDREDRELRAEALALMERLGVAHLADRCAGDLPTRSRSGSRWRGP